MAGSLDPVIGNIICAAPATACTSYSDAMQVNEGSNDDLSAPMGECDSDCDEASSTVFFNHSEFGEYSLINIELKFSNFEEQFSFNLNTLISLIVWVALVVTGSGVGNPWSNKTHQVMIN